MDRTNKADARTRKAKDQRGQGQGPQGQGPMRPATALTRQRINEAEARTYKAMGGPSSKPGFTRPGPTRMRTGPTRPRTDKNKTHMAKDQSNELYIPKGSFPLYVISIIKKFKVIPVPHNLGKKQITCRSDPTRGKFRVSPGTGEGH